MKNFFLYHLLRLILWDHYLCFTNDIGDIHNYAICGKDPKTNRVQSVAYLFFGLNAQGFPATQKEQLLQTSSEQIYKNILQLWGWDFILAVLAAKANLKNLNS